MYQFATFSPSFCYSSVLQAQITYLKNLLLRKVVEWRATSNYGTSGNPLNINQ